MATTSTHMTSSPHGAARALVRAAALALALLLWALPAGAQTILEIWTTEVQPDRMAVTGYLADAFMALHDGIRVQVRGVPEGKMPQALQERKQSGEALPALIYTDSEQLITFARKGWLDTKSANAMVDSLGRDDFFGGVLSALRHPTAGTMYAVPFQGWVQGIWYRADWFEAAGLKPPNSMENILAAARALHDPENGRYGILMGTRTDGYTEQIFTHLALARGVREFDEHGRLVFDNATTARVLDDYKTLAEYGPAGQHNWRARDFYLQGKLAMMFYSTFIMDDLALSSVAVDSLSGRNFKELDGGFFDPELLVNTHMVPIIEDRERAGYGEVVGWGFGSGVPYRQREAARMMLKFLFRTDCYVTWLHMAPGGMLPVRREIADSEQFYRDIQGVFRRYGRTKVTQIIGGLENVSSFSVERGRANPLAAEIGTAGIIPQMVHKALFEGMPAREAVHWAGQQMQKIVDRSHQDAEQPEAP